MYVAVMGYGVVGSGVAAVIALNNKKIAKVSGQDEIKVKYILDLRSFPGDVNEKLVVDDFNVILNDPEVKIVAETMGGLHPAYEFVSSCLKAGKSVVTSNKELVAMKGFELLQIAKENNVNFMFEASVGGGIPIIRPLINDLAANEIIEIDGILNGTTNFILTKMIEDGMSFDEALKIAQQLGYAEKDPTADVEGLDAARKICILAALAFGKHIYPDSVSTKGIRTVTLEDVEAVKNIGGVIKLIASAKKDENGKVFISVMPCVVSKSGQLGSTSDVFNAVLVKGNAVDDVVFYGKGAGKMATASAVVADIIDCARHIDKRLEFGWEDAEQGNVLDNLDEKSSFFVNCDSTVDSDCICSLFNGFNAQIKNKIYKTNSGICFVSGEMTRRELNKLIEGSKIGVKSIYKIMKF